MSFRDCNRFGLPVFSSRPYCRVFDGGIASKVWLGTGPEHEMIRSHTSIGPWVGVHPKARSRSA
jgi:hypothetical protein